MKNFLIATSILIFTIAILSGCKKRYMCECTNVNPYDSTGTAYTIDNPYEKKLSKSQANAKKSECESVAGCTFKRDKGKH